MVLQSKEIENIDTLIKIWTDEYNALKSNPESPEMKAFTSKLDINIYKLTQDILVKFGGSDDTARYYRDDMFEIMSIMVKSRVMNQEISVDKIKEIIFKISGNYFFKKMVTLLEKAEIPIFSAILGIMRTTSSVYNNIDEFNHIVQTLEGDGQNKKIPPVGTIVWDTVKSSVFEIINKSNNILQNLSRPPNNNNTPQTNGGSRYFKKYKKKIQKIQKYNKTKKYNKKYKKHNSYLKKTTRI